MAIATETGSIETMAQKPVKGSGKKGGKARTKARKAAKSSTAAKSNGNGAAQAATATAAGAATGDQTMNPQASEAVLSQKPTVSHMLGEITWIFSQSKTHRHFSIGDLEWMVMPALALEQYRVFRGDKTPVGVAIWAHLNEEAEAKLEAGIGKLRPDEWKSGDRLWLVDVIAPFATPENKQMEAMLADLIKGPFEGKRFKFHVTNAETGVREVKEIDG